MQWSRLKYFAEFRTHNGRNKRIHGGADGRSGRYPEIHGKRAERHGEALGNFECYVSGGIKVSFRILFYNRQDTSVCSAFS